MDSFAALALATDPVSEKFLNLKPDKDASLFSVIDMFKMILLQSAYQIVIILVFHFPWPPNSRFRVNDRKLMILSFYAFVLLQIFNYVNCWRLDNKLNVFEGIIQFFFIRIALLSMK